MPDIFEGDNLGTHVATKNLDINGFSILKTRFADDADLTKRIDLNITGNTTGIVLTLASIQSTAQTLTIPNLTGAATVFVTPALQTLEMNGNTIDNTAIINSNAGTPATAGVLRLGLTERIGWGAGNANIRFATSDTIIIDTLANDPILQLRTTNNTINTLISSIHFLGRDSIPTDQIYAKIEINARNITTTTEEGEMVFKVTDGGAVDTEYVVLNDASDNQVNILKVLDMGADIKMGGNNIDLSIDELNAERITSDADNQTNIYAGGNERFRVGSAGNRNLGTSFSMDENQQFRLRAVATTDFLLSSAHGNVEFHADQGNTEASSDIALFIDGAEQFTFNTTSLDLVGTAKNITLIGSGAVGFLQMAEITDPAAGTNSGKFYIKDVGGISKPFYIGDGQVAVDLTSGGGGGTFTDIIPCVMEVPQGTVAFPDIHAMTTSASKKLSGFVFPDGASTGTVNFKCVLPSDVASTPNATLRFRFLTLATLSNLDISVVVRAIGLADAQDADVAFNTDEAEAIVRMPNTNDTYDYYSEVLGGTYASNDTLHGQIDRRPQDADDDYGGDVLLVGVDLLIDRDTS